MKLVAQFREFGDFIGKKKKKNVNHYTQFEIARK